MYFFQIGNSFNDFQNSILLHTDKAKGFCEKK